MKRNILLLFTFFACITVQGQTPVRLVDLRSEHLDRPIGLDNPVPRLSWRMEDGRQGAVQTSWRIVVDEDSLNVVNGCGRMWDSGKNDSRNQLVAYAGKKLQPFTRYYWKVICSDMEYKETASPVSYFETGEDLTDDILHSEQYTFLLVAPWLKQADDSGMDLINEVYDYSVEHGYRFLCLTASSEQGSRCRTAGRTSHWMRQWKTVWDRERNLCTRSFRDF
jgi:hypothetical protein